jgi:hypothetical protein
MRRKWVIPRRDDAEEEKVELGPVVCARAWRSLVWMRSSALGIAGTSDGNDTAEREWRERCPRDLLAATERK